MTTARIKKIHQIWLSGNPLPKEYRRWSEGWKKFHPDFEYILWDAERVKEFQLYETLKDQCSSWAQKSDVLRYCILERYGGLYVDMDCECFKSLRPLIETNECFFAYHDPEDRQIGIELLYSTPGHPIFKKLVELLPSCDFSINAAGGTGPEFFTIVLQAYAFDNFTRYPRQYFYPYYYDQFYTKKKILPETYAAHHWRGAWLGWEWHFDTFLTKCVNEYKFSRSFFLFFKRILNLTRRLRTEGIAEVWQKRVNKCSVERKFNTRLFKIAEDPHAAIVVVGAYDGISFEEYPNLFSQAKAKLLLIEPLKDVFEKLKLNFSGKKNVIFEKSAIDSEIGTRAIYRLLPEDAHAAGLPDWVLGSSSFYSNKNPIGGQNIHKTFYELRIKPLLKEEKVATLTFEELFKKHSILNIDYLQIDAEGHDYQILKTFPFQKMRPQLIKFEWFNLDDAEQKACLQMLHKWNYQVLRTQFDLKCVRRD